MSQQPTQDKELFGHPFGLYTLFGTEMFERFSFIKQDVTNYIHIDGALDYVLHFASPASPIDYLEKPIQTLKVGSLGTHNTLGLAKDKGAGYLIAEPELQSQAFRRRTAAVAA